MTTTKDYFHRPELADLYAEEALDTSLGRSGGLFLAAPRRTGKSTFARQDLVPALQARGAITLYVDLWADKTKDPALLLANAVRTQLKADEGIVAKFARHSGLQKISIGALGSGLNFDLTDIGLNADATLTEALEALSKANQKQIVLVIDEAQHALTSSNGMNSLFALKAARDALNLSGHGLQVIATGSNRDKLAALVNGREQPFFGATLVDFPKLGQEYIHWVCEKAKIGLDPVKTFEVFKEAGSRPEMILPSIRKMRLGQFRDGNSVDSEFSQLVREDMAKAKENFLNTLFNLPLLQGALMHELAANVSVSNSTEKIGVFSGAMATRLQARINEVMQGEEKKPIDGSAIQSALDSLREKNFLWKSQRGVYWIEDDQLISWISEVQDGLNRIVPMQPTKADIRIESALPAPQSGRDYLVVAINNTSNTAFFDLGRDNEIARIIDDAASKVAQEASLHGIRFLLEDVNGNGVGDVRHVTELSAHPTVNGKVHFAIKLDDISGSLGEGAAHILNRIADQVRNGNHNFSIHGPTGELVSKFEFREDTSLDKYCSVDVGAALKAGLVFQSDATPNGIAEGEYRFVIKTRDTPVIKPGEVLVWLVNAKGDKAPGFESRQFVPESKVHELDAVAKSALQDVIDGHVTFDEFEHGNARSTPTSLM